MTDKTTDFNEWALVELFGHQRLAGNVSNAEIGGCSFIRVDVPANNEHPAFTKYLGNGAIYAINIVSEEVCREAAAAYQAAPIQRYELPAIRHDALDTEPYDDEDCPA